MSATAKALDLIDLTQYEEGGHSLAPSAFAPTNHQPSGKPPPTTARGAGSEGHTTMERLLGLNEEKTATGNHPDSSLLERKKKHHHLLESLSSSSTSSSSTSGDRDGQLRQDDMRLSSAVQGSRVFQQGSRLVYQNKFDKVFEEDAVEPPRPSVQPIAATPSLEEELHRARSLRGQHSAKEDRRDISPNPIEISPSLETEYLTKEQQQQLRLQYSSSPDQQHLDQSSKFFRMTERVIEDRSRQSPQRTTQVGDPRTVIDIESLRGQEGSKNEVQPPKPSASDAGSAGTVDSNHHETTSVSSSSMYRRAIQARQEKRLSAATATASAVFQMGLMTINDSGAAAVEAGPFKPIERADTLGDEDQDSGTSFQMNLREKYRKLAVSPAHSDYEGDEGRGKDPGASQENVVARFVPTPFQRDTMADPVIGYSRFGSAIRHGLVPIKPESPRMGPEKIVLQGAEVVQIDKETLSKYAIDVSRLEEGIDETKLGILTSDSISEPRKRLNIASRSMVEHMPLLWKESLDSDYLSPEIRAVKSMPTEQEAKKAFGTVDTATLKRQVGRRHSDLNAAMKNQFDSLRTTGSGDNKQGKTPDSYRTDLAMGENSSSIIDSAPATHIEITKSLKHEKEKKLMELRTMTASPKSPEELYTRHHNIDDNVDLDDGATSDEGDSRTTTDASRTTDVSYDRREGVTVSSGENSEGKASILSILNSESSDSDAGLHPDLDPHLLYDSEAMHFVISMLDKSCAWLEDDNCTACSFQPSPTLMKEIERKRQEDASVRDERRQQGHIKGRSPSFQSMKSVSASPLVQKLQERSFRKAFRRQRRSDSDSQSETAAVSPYVRPRRDRQAPTARALDASTQVELSEDQCRTPKSRKHTKSQRSPRSTRPAAPPSSLDKVVMRHSFHSQTYSADVSEGEQVNTASYRNISLQVPVSGLSDVEPVKSPAVSPFQRKLQERLASVRGEAEILSATLTPTMHGDESDIQNLNSSPSDPVDLVECGYSHSSEHDENQPAHDSEMQTSPRAFMVSSERGVGEKSMPPKLIRSIDAPSHDATEVVLSKSRSPSNRQFGFTKTLEEEDAALEHRMGKVKLSSENKHQGLQKSRDPSPGGGMLWERQNGSFEDERDEQDERADPGLQHPKLDPEPGRHAISHRNTVVRFREAKTVETFQSPVDSKGKTDRIQLSRSKVMPESLGSSTHAHSFSVFQEEASTQDRSIRSTAGGPEAHRTKPLVHLVGGPLETIAETRDEDEPQQRQLPEEPRPKPQLPSSSHLTADEKHAALELAEKLRQRAHTLKTRYRARFFDDSTQVDGELVSAAFTKQDSLSASCGDGNLSVGASEAAMKGQ